MTDTMGRMHSDAQFAGSSSVPAHVEMMGLIGAGNNPMVGMTVAVAVAVEEAAKAGNSKISQLCVINYLSKKEAPREFSRMALLFCCFRYPAKLGVQIAGTMFQTHAIFF